jgi:hypothetical protein
MPAFLRSRPRIGKPFSAVLALGSIFLIRMPQHAFDNALQALIYFKCSAHTFYTIDHFAERGSRAEKL